MRVRLAIALLLVTVPVAHASELGLDVSHLDCDTPLPTSFGFGSWDRRL
jgi:hypothetical protein